MTNPIIIFEQDCVEVGVSGSVLDEEFVRKHLDYLTDEIEYPEVTIELEYDGPDSVIFQAFNDQGESWKFFQAKR